MNKPIQNLNQLKEKNKSFILKNCQNKTNFSNLKQPKQSQHNTIFMNQFSTNT